MYYGLVNGSGYASGSGGENVSGKLVGDGSGYAWQSGEGKEDRTGYGYGSGHGSGAREDEYKRKEKKG